MKKLLILAAASLIGTAASAQTGNTSTSKMKFGLKAGVNLPNYHFSNVNGSSDVDTKSSTNFHVTGYLDAPLSSVFYIQPGISLQGKGAKTTTGDIEVKQNTMWVEVPVNFVGKVPLSPSTSFYLGAGPYAAFGIAGQNKVSGAGATVSEDVKFGTKDNDDLKGTDLGVNFLAGFQLSNSINVGAGYGLGLTDLRPTTDGGNGKQTNRVWSFSIGYLF